MLLQDLKAKKQAGQQRMAEVVDTSKLPQEQVDGSKAKATEKWTRMRQQIADATELQADLVRVSVFPEIPLFKYHSAPSQVQLDEIKRLAAADGLTFVEKSAPNAKGGRDIILEFDVKAMIAAEDAKAVKP